MPTEKVTELVTFAGWTPGSDLDAALKIVGPLPGLISLRYGAQVEDNQIGYWAIDWEEMEDHTRFTETPGYKPFREILSKVGAISNLVHVLFRPFPPAKALQAPVSEIVVLDVKEGSQPADLEATLTKLSSLIVRQKGAHDAVWGVTHESSTQYVWAIGWDSLEAHKEVSALPEAQVLTAELLKHAHPNVKHATLSTYD